MRCKNTAIGWIYQIICCLFNNFCVLLPQKTDKLSARIDSIHRAFLNLQSSIFNFQSSSILNPQCKTFRL